MNILSDRPVFTVDGEVFHWGDVVRHAQASGRWDELTPEAWMGSIRRAVLRQLRADDLDDIVARRSRRPPPAR